MEKKKFRLLETVKNILRSSVFLARPVHLCLLFQQNTKGGWVVRREAYSVSLVIPCAANYSNG